MRKPVFLFAALLLFPLVVFADTAGEVTSISPTVFTQFSTEQFMTINGTGLQSAGETFSVVRFFGGGQSFEVEAGFNTPTQLVVGVPEEILHELGKYHVLVIVFDADGHQKTLGGQQDFTVVAAPPPPPEPPSIFVPEVLLAEATSPAGATVEYTITAESSNGDPVPVTCMPASGGMFPLGTTNVHCTATDSVGTSMADFSIIVEDTTAPTLTVPDDILTNNPVVTFTATATDIVDPAPTVVCDPPSGSTFPEGGPTEVVCTATDSSLNETIDSFFVTVDTTPPVVTSITATPSALSPPNHEMVPVTITVEATDNLDPNPTSQILSVTSNQGPGTAGEGDLEPDWEITGALTLNLRAEKAPEANRVYTVTVVTTDAAGNMTNSTVAVTVSQPTDNLSIGTPIGTPSAGRRRSVGGH